MRSYQSQEDYLFSHNFFLTAYTRFQRSWRRKKHSINDFIWQQFDKLLCVNRHIHTIINTTLTFWKCYSLCVSQHNFNKCLNCFNAGLFCMFIRSIVHSFVLSKIDGICMNKYSTTANSIQFWFLFNPKKRARKTLIIFYFFLNCRTRIDWFEFNP